MIKVFVHNFNNPVSTVDYFECLVNDYINKLEADPKVISYSSETFFDHGRLILVFSIDDFEGD